MKYFVTAISLLLLATSCAKQTDAPAEPKLIFRFLFDSMQVRLNSQGQAAPVPENHPAQSPAVQSMSTHYIELLPDAQTLPGRGTVLYTGAETNAGGDTAIDITQAVVAGNNEVFYAIPLKDISPGTYEHLRLSIAYQLFTVQHTIDTTINDSTRFQGNFRGRLAAFTGYNQYITTYAVANEFITVNANRLQGYWMLESAISNDTYQETVNFSGQSPNGRTTVVNPLYNTSPLPTGSDVITAAFTPGKLTITGNEDKNIMVIVSLSTNKSFEWEDQVPDGKWDPRKEPVLDMGLRGMIPSIRE